MSRDEISRLAESGEARDRPGRSESEFHAFSHRVLHLANRELPRIDFLRELSRRLIEFSRCETIELWLKEDGEYSRFRAEGGSVEELRFRFRPGTMRAAPAPDSPLEEGAFERFCRSLIHRRLDEESPCLTRGGSFWIGDLERAVLPGRGEARPEAAPFPAPDGQGGSLALIPLTIGDQNIGLLQLRSRQPERFTRLEIALYEELAETLGLALVNERAQAALRERIKELTCLYGLARIAQRPGLGLEEILQGIADLLPPAWQYPEITQGRIAFDGRAYETPGFREAGQKQSAPIRVGGALRGVVEVVYSESRPDLDEGPFLKEERSLINGVARQVALIIESRQAEEERARLQEQLRHADRLATIGQLAAGVAHELNEPLGNILGFAQLAQKVEGFPEQASQDVEKIIKATLHAREVVRKLRLFARETPPQKARVDLNELLEEGLYFIESRCAKAGIELVRSLAPELPEITADKGQLHQVLVNLVVNSIQAMPGGGRLEIRTADEGDRACLIVEDTGTGMPPEIVRKIFVPFFTTKDVNEGTGLGLAVVHGIVSAHGGGIEVESTVGQGTRFTVRFPAARPETREERE